MMVYQCFIIIKKPIGLINKLTNSNRFLDRMAYANGQQVRIGIDTQVNGKTRPLIVQK